MTAPIDSGGSAQPGRRPRMRASDAQREDVVHRLHDAVGTGLLTVEEGHERTAAAFAARYVDELPPLTADLPDPDPAPVPPGWRALAATAALQARTSLIGAPSWSAAERNRRRLVLLAGLALALLVVVALIAAANAGAWEFRQEHFGDRDWP